jgi:hypothetical protein
MKVHAFVMYRIVDLLFLRSRKYIEALRLI